MRIGAIRELREACMQQAGGNVKKANQLVTEQFKKLFEDKKLDPKSISYKALFEGLVNMDDIDANNAVEVAEAVSSSAFTNITTLITHTIVIEPYEVRMNEVMSLVTEGEATVTDEETVRGMTAIGGIRRRLETEAYDETDFGEKRVAIRKSDFGRIISLTMEDIFNDKTGDIQERARTIGEDAGQHQEQMIVETLECLPRTALGESTSRAFVYNGAAYTQAQFYAATHATILDMQVNKNTATGGITEAGLAAAYLNFSAMVDERGKRIVMRPDTVVINSANELTLANILATERSVASAALNDVNQFGPRGRVQLKPIVTPFLATTSGLAYVGVPRRSLLWLWVERPNTVTAGASDEDAFRRRIVWKARFNYYGGLGHRDYRWITRLTTS
jgi:hypothetical protein